jgi:outer membrane protein OmpA-like peptidoglycan-associated protein
MPLFLAAITAFFVAPGGARAEQPIVLAQAQTPQQREEEERKRKAQEQQHQQQQKAPEPRAHEEQLKHQAQEKAPHEKAQEEQHKKAQEEQHKAQEQQHAQQQKLLEEQHRAQELKGKEEAEAKRREQEAAKLRADQAKIQQLQHEQHGTEHQLHTEQQKAASQQQQAHHQEKVLRHELSAEDQKAKAAREAHSASRHGLIEKQKQIAANEKSPAALNERLRLQNEHMRAITSQRQQSTDQHGQAVFKEPGNRTIIQAGGHAFIQHDETVNFRLFGGTPQTVRAANGNMVSTFVRPGGLKLEIEVDGFGRPLRRVRILPDGRRFVLFENRAIALGAGFAVGAFIVALPHIHYDIAPEQYIVDADYASEDDIYGALQAGPVEPLDRGYSLDEVLASIDLRERMRSISIDSINFEFGSSDVGPDQAAMLETVAAVIRDMANQNPGEVFLIEGHTDAVGSDVDNLSLSDRRAEAVADALAQQFGIPRENLVTQGYGKQFLLVPTDGPERRNRRVVIRRITPLLQGDSDRYSGGYGGPGDQGPR